MRLRFPRLVSRTVSDKLALDVIATMMSNEEWNADMFQPVYDIVTATGRKIGDPLDV